VASSSSSFKLVAEAGLGLAEPIDEKWPEFSVAEIAGLSVWWLSASAGGIEKLDSACRKHLGAGLAEQGRFGIGGSGEVPVRNYWAGERQWFVTGRFGDLPAEVTKAGWATDQSDGWVAIRIAGEASRAVMEKVCGLDLHASVFPTGAAARTPIEGMGALIACEDAENGTFVIFFQRSSARSFMEHLRHAAHSASPRQ